MSVPMGYAGVHLRGSRAKEYMSMKPASSLKGWHQQWFYVKNHADSPLPEFTDRTFDEAPAVWGYGPVERERAQI